MYKHNYSKVSRRPCPCREPTFSHVEKYMDKLNKNLKFLIIIRYNNLIGSAVLISKKTLNSYTLVKLRQKVLKILTIKVNTPIATYWYIPGKRECEYCYYSESIKIFGKLHRDDRPAIYWHEDKDQAWYQNGVLHRDIGPAYVLFNNNRLHKLIWYKNGLMHRDFKAAIFLCQGKQIIYKAWYKNGLIFYSTI